MFKNNIGRIGVDTHVQNVQDIKKSVCLFVFFYFCSKIKQTQDMCQIVPTLCGQRIIIVYYLFIVCVCKKKRMCVVWLKWSKDQNVERSCIFMFIKHLKKLYLGQKVLIVLRICRGFCVVLLVIKMKILQEIFWNNTENSCGVVNRRQ